MPQLSRFCVFDYPDYTARDPITSENYITSTSVVQWLRHGLESMTPIRNQSCGAAKATLSVENELEAEEGGKESSDSLEFATTSNQESLRDTCKPTAHPSLSFKQPVKNIHVTLTDVTPTIFKHHYRKTLWEGFYEGSEIVDIKISPKFPTVSTNALLKNKKAIGIEVCPHYPIVADEKLQRFELHVEADGLWSNYTSQNVGFGHRLSDNIDERLYYDIIKSPLVKCPDLLEHPLDSSAKIKDTKIKTLMSSVMDML